MHLDLPDCDAADTAVGTLMSLVRRPTALIASDSAISLGACRAIRRFGLNQQIALVGFDDDLLADLLTSDVTVITPDPVAMGRAAADLLFRRIDGDQSPPIHRVVPPRLVTRGTGEIEREVAQ